MFVHCLCCNPGNTVYISHEITLLYIKMNLVLSFNHRTLQNKVEISETVSMYQQPL